MACRLLHLERQRLLKPNEGSLIDSERGAPFGAAVHQPAQNSRRILRPKSDEHRGLAVALGPAASLADAFSLIIGGKSRPGQFVPSRSGKLDRPPPLQVKHEDKATETRFIVDKSPACADLLRCDQEFRRGEVCVFVPGA